MSKSRPSKTFLGGPARALRDAQVAANRSSLPHFGAFRGHRDRLTAMLANATALSRQETLCILGAGNCYDIDLEAMLRVYASVHLVDLDAQAVKAARARVPPELRSRVVVHAPLDLSGMLARLPDWVACRLRPEELMHWPLHTSEALTSQIGRQFDVVVSSCMLSQMQLSIVEALGDQHPLFQVARYSLNVMHLRMLLRLLTAGGRAFLVTDVASDLDGLDDAGGPSEDLVPLLQEQARRGRLFYATHPGLLRQIADDDPALKRDAQLSDPIAAWLWHNGPERTFLVYAMTLQARGASPTH